MPCCNPMKAFWTGLYTESGKLDLVIMSGASGDLLNVGLVGKKGHRVSPNAPLVKIGMNTYLTDPVSIPCGHCVGCRMDKAREWKERCCDEFRDASPGEMHFVTLTYANRSLPLTKEGEPYLKKSDLDDFLMALRRPAYGVKMDLTFFACGEYGGLNHRPHFHVVMRYPLDDLIPYAWKCCHSRIVDKAWRYKGVTQVKPVEPELIAYVCGYCEKKQDDPFWESYPVKPFTSKSKGLGFNVIGDLKGNPDRKIYGNYGGKHYASIPRAYLRKCENEPWFADFKARSIELGKQAQVTNAAMYGTTDPELIGFLLEESINESLEKKRILKI